MKKLADVTNMIIGDGYKMVINKKENNLIQVSFIKESTMVVISYDFNTMIVTKYNLKDDTSKEVVLNSLEDLSNIIDDKECKLVSKYSRIEVENTLQALNGYKQSVEFGSVFDYKIVSYTTNDFKTDKLIILISYKDTSLGVSVLNKDTYVVNSKPVYTMDSLIYTLKMAGVC